MVLIADFSEPSIGSIFMGRWMKNDWVGCAVYLYLKGLCRKVAGANGRESDRRGGRSHNRLWKGEAYTGCYRRNGPDFRRVFLMLNYTDITQNTYIQS